MKLRKIVLITFFLVIFLFLVKDTNLALSVNNFVKENTPKLTGSLQKNVFSPVENFRTESGSQISEKIEKIEKNTKAKDNRIKKLEIILFSFIVFILLSQIIFYFITFLVLFLIIRYIYRLFY